MPWRHRRSREKHSHRRRNGATDRRNSVSCFPGIRHCKGLPCAPVGGSISPREPLLLARPTIGGHQMPLMAWSSQARGFFARGDRTFTADADLSRCWYSEEHEALWLNLETDALPAGV